MFELCPSLADKLEESVRHTRTCIYFYAIAYRSGGDGAVGGQFSTKALLKADGSVMLFNTNNETQDQITSMTMFLDFYLEDIQADWRRPQSKS